MWRSSGLVGDTPGMTLILAATMAQKRHMQEIGLIICAVGAVVIVLSGAFGLRSMSRAVERSTMVVAGVLLAAGFVVQLLAIHTATK
jgi:ethanolamine utilization microcompartment shell protein EutS